MNFNANITEDELLALIERRELPVARREVVREMLKNDQALARLVRDMRCDCDAARGLGVSAPVGMVEAVQARLERDALMGLSSQAAAHAANDSIPISQFVPARRSALDVVIASPWSRRVATAAAVLLVGAGTWVGVRSLSPAKKPIGPIAVNTSKDNGQTNTPAVNGLNHGLNNGINSTPVVADRTNGNSPGVIADAHAAPNSNTDRDLAAKPTAADPAIPDSAAIANASEAATRVARAESQRLASAAAAGLRGRLVVRVVTPAGGEQAAELVRTLDRLSTRIGIASAEPKYFKISTHDAPEVLTLVRNLHLRPVAVPEVDPAGTGPVVPPDDRTIAGSAPKAPGPNAPAPTEVHEPVTILTPQRMELDGSAFGVSLGATEGDLRSLIGRLSRNGAKVELDVLMAPVPLSVSLDASTMFWWRERPAAWSPRMSVPIVIQTLP